METKALAGNVRLYVEGRSAVKVTDYGGGIELYVPIGVMTKPFAEIMIRSATQQVARHGRYVQLVDAYDATRFDTEFRESVGDWVKAHRDKAMSIILIRSRLLAMAIEVGNLLIGKAKAEAIANVSQWETAARVYVPGLVREPIGTIEEIGVKHGIKIPSAF